MILAFHLVAPVLNPLSCEQEQYSTDYMDVSIALNVFAVRQVFASCAEGAHSSLAYLPNSLLLS